MTDGLKELVGSSSRISSSRQAIVFTIGHTVLAKLSRSKRIPATTEKPRSEQLLSSLGMEQRLRPREAG